MINEYVPKFSHTDWIDNEDRVQAGGEKGINIRFHDLEDEFKSLADKHLNPLIRATVREESFLSLVPILTPTKVPDSGTQPPLPWLLATDVAQKAPGAEEAHGLMNVVLPEGAELKSFLVRGTRPSDTSIITVTLFRKDFSGAGADPLFRVGTLGTAADPLVPGATVTNRTHRYFITADLTKAATAVGADSVKLSCFQISYQ
ncbi:hypothetical protein ACIGZJ_14945 [Kitasatospora sp. NPDC052868]|uniref:hypothetical protein n=1 Tax=Kitasatospora sp. NPDC052868 TaxID=3364060 RepID=UPI0037CA1C55